MNRGTQRVIYHRRWQGLGLATGGMVFCLATAAQGQGVVSNGVAMLAKGAVALYPAADARTTVVAELPEGADRKSVV